MKLLCAALGSLLLVQRSLQAVPEESQRAAVNKAVVLAAQSQPPVAGASLDDPQGENFQRLALTAVSNHLSPVLPNYSPVVNGATAQFDAVQNQANQGIADAKDDISNARAAAGTQVSAAKAVTNMQLNAARYQANQQLAQLDALGGQIGASAAAVGGELAQNTKQAFMMAQQAVGAVRNVAESPDIGLPNLAELLASPAFAPQPALLPPRPGGAVGGRRRLRQAQGRAAAPGPAQTAEQRLDSLLATISNGAPSQDIELIRKIGLQANTGEDPLTAYVGAKLAESPTSGQPLTLDRAKNAWEPFNAAIERAIYAQPQTTTEVNKATLDLLSSSTGLIQLVGQGQREQEKQLQTTAEKAGIALPSLQNLAGAVSAAQSGALPPGYKVNRHATMTDEEIAAEDAAAAKQAALSPKPAMATAAAPAAAATPAAAPAAAATPAAATQPAQPQVTGNPLAAVFQAQQPLSQGGFNPFALFG